MFGGEFGQVAASVLLSDLCRSIFYYFSPKMIQTEKKFCLNSTKIVVEFCDNTIAQQNSPRGLPEVVFLTETKCVT